MNEINFFEQKNQKCNNFEFAKAFTNRGFALLSVSISRLKHDKTLFNFFWKLKPTFINKDSKIAEILTIC